MRGSGVEVRPRVAVVGAGIGGLALAAVLTASGTRCEVFEQARRTVGGGAGVQLAPNAVRPLRRLGLGPVLRAAAVRIEATEVRGTDGGPLARMPLGAACERLFEAPYYTVHRGELHAALLDLVPAENIHADKRLHRLEEDEDGVTLYFEDGAEHRADVVVGADGVGSAVRAALGPEPPRFSGPGEHALAVHYGLLPVERLPRAVAREALVRVWTGPGARLECFPVSGGAQVSFTAVARLREGAEESWGTDGVPEDLAAEFGHWRGVPAQIASAARVAGSVWTRPLYRRATPARWSTPRATLLGDAAHPGLLFTSQATSQAVEDAFDLAVHLARADRDGLSAALARYESLRRDRTAAVEETLGDETVPQPAQDADPEAYEAALRGALTLQSRAGVFSYDAGRRAEPSDPGATRAGHGMAGVG